MTDDDDVRVYPVDGTFWAIVPDDHRRNQDEETTMSGDDVDEAMAMTEEEIKAPNGANGHADHNGVAASAQIATPIEVSDPVWTAAEALEALRVAEVANREAVDRLNWAIEKLIDAGNVQLAAVFDARANELKRAAAMCGMTATDIQLNFKDSDR